MQERIDQNVSFGGAIAYVIKRSHSFSMIVARLVVMLSKLENDLTLAAATLFH
ncbi:hypothetical protein AVDCRST_MAG94-3523 [uncultured Leptolyngbya sp.]|uniref:Uncharacterized protein n=1 Tax=uncultured Leptolyngbya sp. TaxID=332963 RepID=A0A6J4MPP8_9CYAN|nr:hypothetical protein AVDCRST_MAG94-3523 [uncultured Leptolyngbya sp.]